MKKLISVLISLSAFPLVGGACTTGSTAFCEEQIKLECQFAYRCCEDEERIENSRNAGVFFFGGANYANTEQECIERSLPLCKAFFGGIDEAIALGRIELDQAAADSCLAGKRTAIETCSNEPVDACGDVINGLVESGGECATSNECENDGSCEFADPPEVDEELGTRSGECKAPLGAGDSCADDVFACGEGLTCNDEDVCEALPGVGEPCPDFACADGGFCDDDGTCAAVRADGQACEFGDQCESDECEEGECVGEPEICTGRD